MGGVGFKAKPTARPLWGGALWQTGRLGRSRRADPWNPNLWGLKPTGRFLRGGTRANHTGKVLLGAVLPTSLRVGESYGHTGKVLLGAVLPPFTEGWASLMGIIRTGEPAGGRTACGLRA
jgi:hypothetical protein